MSRCARRESSVERCDATLTRWLEWGRPSATTASMQCAARTWRHFGIWVGSSESEAISYPWEMAQELNWYLVGEWEGSELCDSVVDLIWSLAVTACDCERLAGTYLGTDLGGYLRYQSVYVSSVCPTTKVAQATWRSSRLHSFVFDPQFNAHSQTARPLYMSVFCSIDF